MGAASFRRSVPCQSEPGNQIKAAKGCQLGAEYQLISFGSARSPLRGGQLHHVGIPDEKKISPHLKVLLLARPRGAVEKITSDADATKQLDLARQTLEFG